MCCWGLGDVADALPRGQCVPLRKVAEPPLVPSSLPQALPAQLAEAVSILGEKTLDI